MSTEASPVTTPDDTVRLVSLDAEACRALLSTHHFGRLGVTIGHQPMVFPVNYALDGDTIVFRADEGSKLRGAIGRRVAFEIDGVDQFSHTGWSVIVVGDAQVAPDDDHERLQHLPLNPYGPGPKQLWIQIPARSISGRRIVRP